MVYSSISVFLAPIDVSVCLYTSSILLPVSIFILSCTVHQVSLDQMREVVTLYVLGVKVATSFVGIVTAVTAHISAIFHPQKLTSWILMILGVLSSFGAMMSVSTVFFKSNWSDHLEAVRHLMFLVAELLLLAASMLLSVKLALRFKSPAIHYSRRFPESYVKLSGVLLAALLLLGSCTSFLGFVMGVYINTQLLRENTVTGGGLYSGFLGILTSVVFIACMKMCKLKVQRVTLQIVLIIGILCIVSSATSFFTEELELVTTIQYISDNKQIFNEFVSYKILLLSKSTLIELSSLFMTVFTCPLLVSCYTLIVNMQANSDCPPQYPLHSSLSNGPDNSLQPSINRSLNKFHNKDGLFKPSLNIDCIEMSAMTHTTGLGIEYN